MRSRFHLRHCGSGIRTDSRIDNILMPYAKISNGDYNGCMHSMLTGGGLTMKKGFEDKQRDSETGRFPDTHVLTLGRPVCWRSPSEPASFILRSATVAARKGILLRLPAEFLVNCASRKIVCESDDDASRESQRAAVAVEDSSSHSGRSTTHTSSADHTAEKSQVLKGE